MEDHEWENGEVTWEPLRFRTELPDYSDIPESVYDWEKSIYGKVEECIPHDIPKPLGKPVIFTAYEDANLIKQSLTLTPRNNLLSRLLPMALNSWLHVPQLKKSLTSGQHSGT